MVAEAVANAAVLVVVVVDLQKECKGNKYGCGLLRFFFLSIVEHGEYEEANDHSNIVISVLMMDWFYVICVNYGNRYSITPFQNWELHRNEFLVWYTVLRDAMPWYTHWKLYIAPNSWILRTCSPDHIRQIRKPLKTRKSNRTIPCRNQTVIPGMRDQAWVPMVLGAYSISSCCHLS